MKPKILIPTFRVERGEHLPIDIFRINEPFVTVLQEVGALPIGMPTSVQISDYKHYVEMVDGLLLQGGHDIHPDFFAPEEELHPAVHSISKERDNSEIALVKAFYEAGKPILGICRGIQVINVAFGGTIFQDLPTQNPSSISHFPNPEIDIKKVSLEDTERNVHEVSLKNNSLLQKIFGKQIIGVNSLHHQSVKNIGKELVVTAKAEDGVIEGIESNNMEAHWILGVQWHPEFSKKLDDDHKEIFREFVQQVKKHTSNL